MRNQIGVLAGSGSKYGLRRLKQQLIGYTLLPANEAGSTTFRAKRPGGSGVLAVMAGIRKL